MIIIITIIIILLILVIIIAIYLEIIQGLNALTMTLKKLKNTYLRICR